MQTNPTGSLFAQIKNREQNPNDYAPCSSVYSSCSYSCPVFSLYVFEILLSHQDQLPVFTPPVVVLFVVPDVDWLPTVLLFAAPDVDWLPVVLLLVDPDVD